MCRLAYIPDAPMSEDKELVETLFEFLELSFGGHGNGIGYFKDGEPYFKKGVTAKTDNLTSFMVNEGVPAIFHTRLASMGSVCDDNCHPFRYNGVLTAHNGHWIDAKEMAQMLIHAQKFSEKRKADMTDSEVIACLVGNYGFGSTDIVNSGVILSLYKDHAKVYVSGDFEYIKLSNGKHFYASEFPRKIIDEWKAEEYFKFDRGSVAKLTTKGPILVRGKLSKTVPSSWPTYNRAGARSQYRQGFDWDNLYGYEDGYHGGYFRKPTQPEKKAEPMKSFLPKRKGKKKNRSYDTQDIVRLVSREIGYKQMPDIDGLADSIEHMELGDALHELHDELDVIIAMIPYKQNKQWLGEEINELCEAWLVKNKKLVDEYQRLKCSLEEVFCGSELDGDRYEDGYGNIWIFFQDEWMLKSDLSQEELNFLERGFSE